MFELIRANRRKSAALIVGFVVIRYLNVYGDKPWFHGETPLRTVMSFLLRPMLRSQEAMREL